MMRELGRAAVGAVVTAFVLGTFAPPASAHVTIDTLGTAVQGGFAKFGFSVPNERDDSATVSLRVQMPRDHPLAFVSVQPKPGWRAETTTRTLDTPIDAHGASISDVVDTITWTSTDGTRIGPGEFDSFWVSAGSLPTGVAVLEFPAIQIYESGEEVAWIESAPEGGDEPEHPVPVLELVPAGAGGETVTASGTAAGVDDDADGTGVATAALIVAGVAVIVALTSLVAGRRRSAA